MAGAEHVQQPGSRADVAGAVAPPVPAGITPSGRHYPVGPREETRRARRDEPHGRPLRIGLLGTSGAGKTTFQTALAYVLVRQYEGEHDPDDPLFGNPVGQETKQFLSVRVHELIAGQFPLPTNDATNLFYRIEAGDETLLTSIMDYRGGDLSEIYSRDAGKPMPASLQEVADYFADCDAYIFLVNARTLLLDEGDEQFQRFWNEFLVYKDVLQHLIDSRPRFRGKISDPFALVATQTDAIDLDGPDVRRRLDRSLDNLRRELERHVRYPETFLTSAIGRRFLDPDTGQKLPRAQLEPDNVLSPLRFILRTRRQHRRLRRRLLMTSLSVVLLGGLVLGLLLGVNEAHQRLERVTELGRGLESLGSDALTDRLKELERRQSEMGIFSALVTEDATGAFRASRDAIIDELTERDFQAVKQAFETDPTDVSTIGRLADAYLREHGNRPGKPYADDVRELFNESRRRYDDRLWAEASRLNTDSAYDTYLDTIKEQGLPGLHVRDAHRAKDDLERAGFVELWAGIVDGITRHPERHEQNIEDVDAFMRRCPPQTLHALVPPPQATKERLIEAWDEQLWSDLDHYYRSTVDVDSASISGSLRPAITRLREYLTRLETLTTPAHAAEARQRIQYLESRSVEREYRIRLLNGDFTAYQHMDGGENTPDVYIKVFVNGELKFSTDSEPRHDTNTPVWNLEFTVRWKAYDPIRVEVYDQDPWPNGHDHIFYVERSGLDAIDRALGGRIWYRDPESGGEIHLSFQRMD